MKHTQGPWEFIAEPTQGAFICAEDGAQIAEMFCTGENDRQVIADGNLIAAAPELLAALRRVEQLLQLIAESPSMSSTRGEAAIHAELPSIRDAIAKAGG